MEPDVLRASRLWRHALTAVALVVLAGCDTLGYYYQAFSGQTEMWRASRPIDEVIADPQVPAAVKDRLAQALELREFAARELALPDNGSYRNYADLKRQYVVWNVFAAGALSIDPKRWCFPVAGCVAYKGYFSKAAADTAAQDLRREGYDVFVSGVPAYSTLGYFDDPVLNTFLHYPPAELARLIFHELAHQVVYVRDDSVFNESFAVTVEREGVKRWIRARGTEQQLVEFERSQKMREAFHALAAKYRQRLASLYATAQSDAAKRAGKNAVLADLAEEYASFKAAWQGFRGYDPWLGPEANNATLASIALYTQQVPAFQAMLAAAGGDLGRFYAEVKALAALPRAERDAKLAEIVDTRAAPGAAAAR